MRYFLAQNMLADSELRKALNATKPNPKGEFPIRSPDPPRARGDF
jgi:hypothetical protein